MRFAHQIQSGIREVQQWVIVIAAAGVAAWLLIRYDRARRRSGLLVGPPVLESDEVPLPASDLDVGSFSVGSGLHDERGTTAAATDPGAFGPDDNAAVASVGSEAADSSHQPAVVQPPPRSHEALIIDLEAGQPHSSIESPSAG